MATNFKAADLIGKTIVVGDNQAMIMVKSVQDNGMLACEFKKTGDANATPLTVTLPNLNGMVEKGLWQVKSDVGSLKSEVGSQTSDISPQTSNVTTEADVAEVNDIMPKVTKRPTPEPLPVSEGSEQTAAKVKPIGKPKQDKPKAKPQPSKGKYVYSTYQTSKGKTGAKITGVSETDAAYQQAAAIHASASYERDKDGNKQFYLCFGPRYAEAAKQVCEALNAGKPIEDAIAIIDKATEERATKREEWKQKREERKAQTSTAKTYTAAEVADLIQRMANKDPKALAEYEAMLQVA